MPSEKRVTAATKRIASSPALTWTQREKPVRWAAAIGIEAPAMKPATQAVAVQGEDQRVAPEDRQQVAGLGRFGQTRPCGSA